ncbi:MAG TPA: hypothetical protein VFQ82_10500 [Stellaceae bacterium]|nr:hypothetical protein [Stellaceae bacterium]
MASIGEAAGRSQNRYITKSLIAGRPLAIYRSAGSRREEPTISLLAGNLLSALLFNIRGKK